MSVPPLRSKEQGTQQGQQTLGTAVLVKFPHIVISRLREQNRPCTPLSRIQAVLCTGQWQQRGPSVRSMANPHLQSSHRSVHTRPITETRLPDQQSHHVCGATRCCVTGSEEHSASQQVTRCRVTAGEEHPASLGPLTPGSEAKVSPQSGEGHLWEGRDRRRVSEAPSPKPPLKCRPADTTAPTSEA